MTSIIAIRVTPRSSKPGIGEWRSGSDGRKELEVRVAVAPTDGEANAAVVKLLAKQLGLPKRSVEIVSGETSRHKRISIALDRDELMRRLETRSS